MSRVNRWLIVLVVAELVLGGVLAAGRLARPVPPEPDFALLDPATAAQLRAAVAGCRSADDWRNLGELYMAAGCFRESEICHRVSCQLGPGEPTFARQWGFALERLALLDEANAQYRRAIELGHPDPDGCAYLIARNHLRAERPAEAREVFGSGRKLAANRYELARMHLRAGELSQAAELEQGLTTDRPDALQVHLLGYRLALERGDDRRALIRADRARYAPAKLLNPFDEEAERVVTATALLGPGRDWKDARDLIEAGRLDDAENAIREAAQVYRRPGVDDLLAEVAVRRSRFAEAVGLFEGIESRDGPSARLAARIGDVWDAAGQPEKARASWLRALRLEAGADLKAVHHNLARSFSTAGDATAAEHHLARGHYYVGRDILQLGHAPESVNYFAAAVEHDSRFAQGWFYLGEARRLAGEPDPAATAYRTCLKLNPDHGRALAGLSLIEGGAGK